ncbi:Intracellular exo-alpha-(1-_5)-L-arabinofuranosidase [termite gut metagenome]|uniref:non-reducing end alpha-L-arabinofuranosidase n=1 Tax=termite gut metagenome TaxID=433724 RepID=A0A5J4S7V4_9ZZZZ
MKHIRKILFLCGLWIAGMVMYTQSPVVNGFLIEKDSRLQAYNRMIFGQFIEHFHRQIYGGIFEPESSLSDKDGFRTDVTEALRELKIPIVRWPGGCFVSSYHWLNGVGSDRQPAYDKAWQVEDPNTFGTVEFVKWCRLIGAEPFICTNAGTGTPEEMSDWVEYCNLNIGKYARLRKSHDIDQPLNVKYWSIGNENYGGWEMGAKTVEEWGPFVRESAKLMHNTDPDIKLFAAALSDENWTLPLLQKAGYLLDYVSLHGYWDMLYAKNAPSPYIECMMRTTQPANDISKTIAVLEKAKLRGKVKIAFDEWNLRGWHHPGQGGHQDIAARDKNDINSTYTMADALFSACFLNTCLRNCKDVEIGGFSPVVNTRGALFVHPKGIVKRTTFHVLKLYADKLEKNVLPVQVTSADLVHGEKTTPVSDAVVTCNDAKTRFVLAVVNKHPDQAIEFAPDFVNMNGTTPKQVSATVLSGAFPDDYNDIGAENRVVPEERVLKVNKGKLSLPPHSLVIITISKE